MLVWALGNIMVGMKGGSEQKWVYFPAMQNMGCVPEPWMFCEKPKKALGELMADLMFWDYFWPCFFKVLQLVQEIWQDAVYQVIYTVCATGELCKICCKLCL